MLLKYISLYFIFPKIELFYSTDGYILYCGPWLSDAVAKLQISLWKSFHYFSATYFISIYSYTMNILTIVMSYSRKFVSVIVK